MSITARKLPPGPIPTAEHVDHHPANRAGHGWPSGPHAFFESSVQVEQGEWNDVGHAGFGESLLAPCFENDSSSRGLGRVCRWGAWEGSEGSDGGDFVMEVVGKRFAERVHDGDKLGAVKGRGGRQGRQIRVEIAETY